MLSFRKIFDLFNGKYDIAELSVNQTRIFDLYNGKYDIAELSVERTRKDRATQPMDHVRPTFAFSMLYRFGKLTTRFQLILPVQSQNVTKKRTNYRMHIEGPQISQINRWNNSFQNMYDMNRQQLTVWPGKSILCKKHLIFAYFGGHESELPDFVRTWTQNH